MKMRLGFSVAIHTDPDILIVDEVLAVGDEGFQHKCFSKIDELQKHGKTILFVSHDMNVVRKVSGRVIWLHHGRVLMDGKPAPVIESYVGAEHDPDLTPAGS
jgi:ABC-2 type transport system ATP-binding protein/lipopolysaccharide transport system ATP-binding protein